MHEIVAPTPDTRLDWWSPFVGMGPLGATRNCTDFDLIFRSDLRNTMPIITTQANGNRVMLKKGKCDTASIVDPKNLQGSSKNGPSQQYKHYPVPVGLSGNDRLCCGGQTGKPVQLKAHANKGRRRDDQSFPWRFPSDSSSVSSEELADDVFKSKKK